MNPPDSVEHGHVQVDATGRITRIIHPGGGTTEICYDTAGRRSSTLEPDGTLTTYKWNELDRITEITRSTADARTWRLTVDHDNFGLLRRVDADEIAVRGRPIELKGLILLGERAITFGDRSIAEEIPIAVHDMPRRRRQACLRHPLRRPAEGPPPTT